MFNLTSYKKLDDPQISAVIFYPRSEESFAPFEAIKQLKVEVDSDIAVLGRFSISSSDAPNILFFHGNGEIASEYDEIGQIYKEFNLNFCAFDFRGYGESGGTPQASTMMQDCHKIFEYFKKYLSDNDLSGPIIVMGRSLGSASAIELASSYQNQIAGLILDSGFAQTLPLLITLGVDIQKFGLTEMDGFKNVQKISRILLPTYMLHGQFDQIIPTRSAEILQVQSPARIKQFQVIPGADHNTIISIIGRKYFEAIHQFITIKILKSRPKRYKSRRKKSA